MFLTVLGATATRKKVHGLQQSTTPPAWVNFFCDKRDLKTAGAHKEAAGNRGTRARKSGEYAKKGKDGIHQKDTKQAPPACSKAKGLSTALATRANAGIASTSNEVR